MHECHCTSSSLLRRFRLWIRWVPRLLLHARTPRADSSPELFEVSAFAQQSAALIDDVTVVALCAERA
jgi:hypothetical protein